MKLHRTHRTQKEWLLSLREAFVQAQKKIIVSLSVISEFARKITFFFQHQKYPSQVFWCPSFQRGSMTQSPWQTCCTHLWSTQLNALNADQQFLLQFIPALPLLWISINYPWKRTTYKFCKAKLFDGGKKWAFSQFTLFLHSVNKPLSHFLNVFALIIRDRFYIPGNV